TASIFDPPFMRARLGSIRSVRIVSAVSEDDLFGERVEGLYYASWLSVQLGHHIDREGSAYGSEGKIDYRFERRRQQSDSGSVVFVEIQFDDGSSASIEREAGSLRANVVGAHTTTTVTRCQARDSADLIVRQLAPTRDDLVFTKALPLAAALAKQLR
ncbi:MAG TPA: OpcA/G6PD domain-containing protein, partial [Thermoanaerobaculia bacterium]